MTEEDRKEMYESCKGEESWIDHDSYEAGWARACAHKDTQITALKERIVKANGHIRSLLDGPISELVRGGLDLPEIEAANNFLAAEALKSQEES